MTTQYLQSSEFINADHPRIEALAKQLKSTLKKDTDIAKACFEYVRDSIKHSGDAQIDIITCVASDVLKYQTGYCYAKSHLLAALLRANHIPAGLCYQRLSLNDHGAPYCLHGLNAVYLEEFGWYRMDPRGNKTGVNALFAPPTEHLAFSTNERLEADLQGIWPEPLPLVVNALKQYNSCAELNNNLPDIDLYG